MGKKGLSESWPPSSNSIEEQFTTSRQKVFIIFEVRSTEGCLWKGEESQPLSHLQDVHTILKHRCLVKHCPYLTMRK